MTTTASTPRIVGEAFRARRSPARRLVMLIRRYPGGVFGISLLAVVLFVALFAGQLTDKSPLSVDPINRLSPPMPGHPFGTDNFGRDVYARTLYGARTSLLAGFGVAIVALLGGIVFGLLAGYYRRLDTVLMRIMDAVMAFPGIILAIGIVAARGPSLTNVIIALGFIFIPRVARVVRSIVLAVREYQFVEAARTLGASDVRILLRHVLPNAWSVVAIQGTFIFAEGVLGEATLSFLGVGPPPEFPSWGNILGEARLYIREAPWLMFLPGLALTLTVLSLNLIGDAVRDALDPRSRRRVA